MPGSIRVRNNKRGFDASLLLFALSTLKGHFTCECMLKPQENNNYFLQTSSTQMLLFSLHILSQNSTEGMQTLREKPFFKWMTFPMRP